MFDRVVMIVDDNENVGKLDIPIYEGKIKKKLEKRQEFYKFEFVYAKSIEDAKAMLDEKMIIDIMVIDYNFNCCNNNLNGVDLINYVRSEINKNCKILFYTMNDIFQIPQKDLISLINNNIYKLLDKANISESEFCDILIQAGIDCNPIVVAFESYWNNYKHLFEGSKYKFLGQEQGFEEIIKHIRMMDKIGSTIVDKILYKTLLEETELEED